MSLPLSTYDPDQESRPRKPKTNITELRKIIFVYKLAAGFPKEDKMWDKHFFPIYMATAKKLYDIMDNNWQWACDCIQDTMEKIREWNPEATISLQNIYVKHSYAWKLKKQENIEKQKMEII